MTVTVYTPFVECTINGVQPAQPITKARVESSFSDPVTKGYVTFKDVPTWGHGDDLTISMGNGTNNVLRFTGALFQADHLNSGPTVELVARGPLYAVQKYRNPYPNGLTLLDLTGGPATDEAIARAVLDVVGVTYTSGNIDGTGITRGELAAVAYVWKHGETALDYLQRLSKASLGYRMIETIGGDIYRVQIYNRPGSTPDFTFTEGVDIFEGAHTQRTTFGRYLAWSVTGFDYGDGLGPVSYSNPADPGSLEVYTFSSEMIEKSLQADPGSGVSAEEVEAYIEAESDHEIVKLGSLSTPRDDLFGPGQTHLINSALVGVTGEDLRLMGVTVEVEGDWFTQTMEYLGGGTPPAGGYGGP